MSFALDYLHKQRNLLPSIRFGRPDDRSVVMLTPAFATSAHVVFLIHAGGAPAPVLVLKVARLDSGRRHLEREAANLRAIQTARPQGFESIPQVLASGAFRGSHVMMQTGLGGEPVTRKLVADRFDVCMDAVLNWVREVHGATRCDRSIAGGDCFALHAAEPLAVAETLFPGEHVLLDRTRAILDELRGVDVATVFEHGDLCAPNLLLDAGGGLQVVDWELASGAGLPCADLFFALAYLSIARSGARTDAARAAAVHAAFFGGGAWCLPLVEQYRLDLGIAADLVRPLFVLCWLRYVVSLAQRLCLDGSADPPAGAAAWLRGNRYFHLWEAGVLRYAELLPSPSSSGRAPSRGRDTAKTRRPAL